MDALSIEPPITLLYGEVSKFVKIFTELTMLKIDVHAHILPQTWDSLKDKYGYGGFIQLHHHQKGRAKMMRDDGTFFREIEENCWNPTVILQDMDAHNVDVMVLCTVPVLFKYWAKPEHTLDWHVFLNNHLAEVQTMHPQRLVGLGTIPMQDTDLAIKELERCVKDCGFPGIQIGSNINGKNLDHPDFFPIYQAAQDLGACIMVHPWEMAGANRMKPYFMEWLVGMPAETTLSICSMIFGGVFDRFPRLRVLFAHAGGSFPFTVGRISHGWHARPDLCNVHHINDPRYYVDKFWVDGITHDDDALRFLLQVMPSHKVAYGTDYPFPLGDLEHGKFIEEMKDLDVLTKEDLFHRSALGFLGLPEQRFLRRKPNTAEDFVVAQIMKNSSLN